MRLIRLTIAIAALVIVCLFGVPLMRAASLPVASLPVPPCNCVTNKGHHGLWNSDYTDCNIDAECALNEE